MTAFISKLKWFLPLIIVLVFVIAGAGTLTTITVGVACFVLLWWVGRLVKPEGELPNASVSCCHYLGEDVEE